MSHNANFADRLLASSRRLHAPIVAGIDPRPDLLSKELISKYGSHGSDLAAGYAEFGEQILAALKGVVPAIKVQVAFFEALGVAGLQAYAKVVRAARDLGFLVIGDIKRADIGTTAEAYAEGHLTPGSDFEVDAVTVNPYLGEDGIAPFRALCEKHGKGLFVLVRTSNPSARQACGPNSASTHARVIVGTSENRRSVSRTCSGTASRASGTARSPQQFLYLAVKLACCPLAAMGFNSQQARFSSFRGLHTCRRALDDGDLSRRGDRHGLVVQLSPARP